jgi:DNA-binding IclR family transcriptional regulator
VVSGQRVPIELTSLGRAWLAVAPAGEREALFAEFAARRSDWPRLRSDIGKAIDCVRHRGWCAASWQPEVVALATPLKLDAAWGYVLNVSVSSTESPGDVAAELSVPLLALSQKITRAVDAQAPTDGRRG